MTTPRGFTLFELILATATAAMLAVGLYSSLHIAVRARESAREAIDPRRTAAIALDLIRQDLQSIQPPVGTLAGPFFGEAPTQTGARADRLAYHTFGTLTTREEAPFAGTLRHVELLVVADGGRNVLVRQVRRNLLAQIEPEPEVEVLCRDVTFFAARYFDGDSWYDAWDSDLDEGLLPQVIEITLEHTPDAGQPVRLTRVFPITASIAPAPAPAETEATP